MYFIQLTQYENDIKVAQDFLRDKPQSYCSSVLALEQPADIILVNAIEQVYQVRSFKKIIDSNVATPDELAYVVFLLSKICGADARFAYGRKTIAIGKSWVEINNNNNYYILDPVTKNVINAPNMSYIPIFAFDGKNLIFIDNNM